MSETSRNSQLIEGLPADKIEIELGNFRDCGIGIINVANVNV